MTIPAFRRKILNWYEKNKRDLPWRLSADPYKILVSEIMLQQTQVNRVIPKYELFLKEFPTVQALAKAPDKKLLAVWSGLGYWRRARFLKETAEIIVKNFNGKFPQDIVTLCTLPGIGPYTAGAIACFAFGNREAFIDTNIRRVYLHFFFAGKQNVSDKEILPIAQKAIDGLEHSHVAKFEAAANVSVRDWGWALFDYGATVLRGNKANQRSKHYIKQGQFIGSFRSFRAKAVKKLLASPKQQLASAILLDFLDEELRAAEKDWSAQEVLNALVKDKLIRQSKNVYRI